jgi:hypothetical protein
MTDFNDPRQYSGYKHLRIARKIEIDYKNPIIGLSELIGFSESEEYQEREMAKYDPDTVTKVMNEALKHIYKHPARKIELIVALVVILHRITDSINEDDDITADSIDGLSGILRMLNKTYGAI